VLAFQFSGRSNALKYSPAAAARSSNGTAVDNDIITMTYVVELHAKVIATQIKARACERRWKLLIKMIKKYEILVNGTTHSLTHSLTHLLTYLLTYSLTHLLTYLLTYLLTKVVDLLVKRVQATAMTGVRWLLSPLYQVIDP